MTFGFRALGSKDEVLAQLQAYDDSNYGDLGKDVRDLVANAIDKTTGTAVHSSDQWTVKYNVTASGHGDTNSCNFQVEVLAHWVPNTDKEKSDAKSVPVSSDSESPTSSTAESGTVEPEATTLEGPVSES